MNTNVYKKAQHQMDTGEEFVKTAYIIAKQTQN